MRTRAKIGAVVLCCLAAGMSPAVGDPITPPAPPPSDWGGQAGHGGGADMWGRDELAGLGGAAGGGGDSAGSPQVPMEYGSSLACHNDGPYLNGEAEPSCTAGYGDPCLADPSKGPGPATAIWGRELNPTTGEPVTTVWTRLGVTCLPDAIPAGARLPVSMIVSAFHRTPWAKATISTQPKGDVTLVGLKTFYKANWQINGFQPGEVESIPAAQMLGFNVDVRPKLLTYVYSFGDGETSEPTVSAGGVYPDGDVIHMYREKGRFVSRVAVTFGADYRLNGGPWQPMPGQATVTMPSTTVTVKEARAVLVNH